MARRNRRAFHRSARDYHKIKLIGPLVASPEQDAYFALMAHGRNPFKSGRSIVSALPGADARFRELLGLRFAGGSMEAGMLLGDLSAALRSDTNPADGWFIATALLEHPTLGASRFEFSGPPWDWVWAHANTMPPSFEVLLRNRLKEQPAMVVYAMATSIVEHWTSLPTWMRDVVNDPKVLESGPTQGRLLLEIARHWNTASELHVYLRDRMTSRMSRVRAAVGIAALVFYENAPTEFDGVSLAMTADPDITVPLEVFEEGLGQKDFCQSFAARLFERADDVACADMFATLLFKNDRCPWQNDLLRACEMRGGLFAEAVKIAGNFGPFDSRELEGIGSEEPILTLARLWRYVNMSGMSEPQASVDVDPIVRAILTLPPVPMFLAVRVVTSQWRYLPEELRRKLSDEPEMRALLSQESPDPTEAQDKTTQTLRLFPIRLLVALRQEATSKAGGGDHASADSPAPALATKDDPSRARAT
ncbi:hypothetical protein [Sorangium sp. So ce124]|uniref:hypothetical protein n=1 Tax=Sorangium sp. So ce124 TaxID=3133280 RepID=UPI003F61EE89